MGYNAVKPIGGEFWFDLDLFNKDLNNDVHGTLLSGGQSAIKFILDKIAVAEDETVLLPSYLCPSILQWFKKKNIKYVFYNINKDLSIDLEYLKNCIDKYKVKVVFFINYFGFHHNDETLTMLKRLKDNGIMIIEDAVQMLWMKSSEKFIGNFVFNSLRKFVPIDGSIVLGAENSKKVSNIDKYLELSYKARMNKTLYQCFGIGNEDDFLSVFNDSEEYYYKREQYQYIDEQSLSLVNRLDIEFISNKRKRNYQYVFDQLGEYGITPLFKYCDVTVPLGVPILVENRDFIRKELRKKNIYCPVHWDIRQEDWIGEFKESYYIADNILTLPIDQRYDEVDMDRLVKELVILIQGKDN